MRRLAVVLAALTLAGAASVAPSRSAEAQTAGAPAFITGTGDHTTPDVRLYDASGQHLGGFWGVWPIPDNSNTPGARVAAGDVDGDLRPEIIVATGRGVASKVSVWSMDGGSRFGGFLGSFSPYGAFPGGVNVGVGDVDGDGVDEIVTAAGAGGGPHIVVWDWSNGVATAKYGWYAYAAGFTGGVNVTVSDVINSSRDDVVTAPDSGGGPHVRIWDLGSGAPVIGSEWMAYDPAFTGGVRLGAGEIDGARRVVTGAGPGGGPHVRVFSSGGAPINGFFAYAPAFAGGVNVMVSAPQGGDLARIITAPATWGGPHVRAWTSGGAEIWGFMAYGGTPINGVTLAPIPSTGTSNNTNQNGSSSSSEG
ncbi:MAG TPA: FG-GAP-like repeat-containing protein [Acidimicrobiales bacterium]|nr:FG-GAP-like repeat-containing protein [Acidimicrobiales bacterium]